MTENDWDCVVVGAGAAGLSAALTLGRGRRSTLVVDTGKQSNLATTGIRGLLGQDGRPPADFYADGLRELRSYPSVTVQSNTVTNGRRERDGAIVLTLTGDQQVRARSVILAPGMDYRCPLIPGLPERWGGTVFHCPFCHGWELRDRPMAVLADGAVGAHGALNLRSWTDRVTLLTNGEARLTDEQRAHLRAGGVGLDERPLAALQGPGQDLESVVFTDGGELAVGALLVKVGLYQRSRLAQDLGAVLTEPDEMLTVQAITVDPMGRTGVPGLFAAGDAATTVPPSMAAAVASGYLTGAAAVVQLAAGS
jgi:thioredoxin reductase